MLVFFYQQRQGAYQTLYVLFNYQFSVINIALTFTTQNSLSSIRQIFACLVKEAAAVMAIQAAVYI